LTHGENHFLLVKSYTKLGEAYLEYGCHEFAIDHLTMALKKNKILFEVLSETKIFHSTILCLIGK
jgi:hypothetical protein